MWDEGRLEYGSDERQAVDLTIPPIGAPAANGLAVLVHGSEGGGTSKFMEPLGVNLMAHGWAVANVEYRGGEDASADAATGIQEARAWFAEVGGTGPLIAVGHADGAPLVLGAAAAADAIVALDPRLDGLGDARAEKPVCLVVARGDESGAQGAIEAAGADVEVVEARELDRGLAVDPHSAHWPEVASWIHKRTGARSDPLGDK